MKAAARILVALILSLAAGPMAGQDVPPEAETLHRLALDGDADAQYALGLFFLNRLNEPDLAAHWLERSADQDHPHAALELGLLLADDGSLHQPQRAVKWIELAAEAGLGEAAAELGLYHFEGFGSLEPDCGEALRWLEIGDLKKSTPARNNLVWVLSTCPEPSYRNGRRALRLGLQVVYREGLHTPGALDTLAAAFAEVGDFLSAIEVQQEAIELLDGRAERQQSFLQRLKAYRERRPWRGPSHSHIER